MSEQPLFPVSPLDARSRDLRRLILSILRATGRGHLGSALSLVEILRALYDSVLRFKPEDPLWPGRDRCLLSKGHGALALYAMLADKGFMPMERLAGFAGVDSELSGLSVRVPALGIECSGGSLGHGLPLGVGMALALARRQSGSRIFVIMGDGETQEGSVWEAALSAARHKLDNLCVIIDHNGLQSWGPLDAVIPMRPYAAKWEAFGFATRTVNGHDVTALADCLADLTPAGKPHAVICHTVKGRGMASVENNLDWHHQSRIAAHVIDELEHELEAGI